MSEHSGGDGWWLASDGRWYPPEQSPGPVPAPTGSMADPTPAGSDRADLSALRIAIVAGAAAMLLGVFATWASAGPFSINGIDTDDGKLFLGLAFGAALLAVLEFARPPSRRRGVAGAVLGVLAAALAVFEIVDISRLGGEGQLFEVSAGGGLYVCLVGSLVFGFGAILQISGAPAREPAARPEGWRPWWKSRWAIGIGIAIGLFIVLGIIGNIVGDDDDESGSAPPQERGSLPAEQSG